MSHAAWDGQRLDCDPLSLVLLRIGEARPAPILTAGAGEGQWVIWPEQIGEFLRAHREILIICHDVGPLFWTISDHLRGGSDQTALDVWWDWPRSGRLRDVMLLDQLIREANHPARPHAASLPDLAGRTLGVTLATEATFQARSSVQAQGLGQQANSDPLDDLCRRAGAVLGIYQVLLGVADQIIRAEGIDPTTIGRFGPLALDLQVQGAIALAAAERAGLAMDEAAQQEIVKACEAIGKASIETLWGDTEARRCLVHDGDGPKFTATGFPQFRKRSLEVWLEQLAASMACLHAIPFTPPMSADGRTSTDPAEWGFWRRCHPLLRAWSDLMAASSLRHRYAQSNEPMTHPRHELIPTIRSIGPALDQLRRLGVPSIFRPRPRQKFLVVTIPNLEARALAAICSRRAGSHGRRAMAEIFERGDEILAATVTRLLLLGRGDFEALERRDPDLHQHGMKLADMLLYAVPRGIDPGLLRSIAKDVFGVSPIPCAIPKQVDCSVPRQELSIRMYVDPKTLTIEVAYRQLWNNIYQELVKHLYDDALEVLAKNLGIAPRECAEQFGLASEFASTQNALRKLLLGLESEYSTERHQAWKNQVWHHLREHDRDGRWGPLIKAERGSQAVYAALLSRDVVTPVGRVHGRLDYPTARSRPFLSLAGDAAKAALFAVVAAGYRLVAFEDGEFVVEIPVTADLEARRLEVEHLAGRAAEVVLDGIPVPCKGEFRDRW